MLEVLRRTCSLHIMVWRFFLFDLCLFSCEQSTQTN
uniref:Uncharacterized protein n=1 Tax=Anguilla anguilla TaxID=7936 RepID=A0A0E9WBG0_ANGAN